MGYTRPAAKPLTIENVGNQVATIDKVELPHETHFTLGEVEAPAARAVRAAPTVPVGGVHTEYTIQPVHGLSAGEYTVEVTLTYHDGNGGSKTETDTVVFTVSPQQEDEPNPPPDDSNPPEDNSRPGGGSAPASTANAAPAPQTGDNSNAGLWIVLLIAAALGLLGVGLRIYVLHKSQKEIAQYDLPQPRARGVSFQPKDAQGEATDKDKE